MVPAAGDEGGEQVRDPRKEPKAGDHIRKGKVERTVIAYSGGNVEYFNLKASGCRSNIKNCWITTWQDWCRNAEVLHAAD